MSYPQSAVLQNETSSGEGKKNGFFSPVDFKQVEITDTFFAPRQRLNTDETIWAIYSQLEQSGRLAALRGVWSEEAIHRGKFIDPTPLFWDSDVAKWLEAASYCLALNPEPKLVALVDEVIADVASAQQSDGYLNTWFTFVEPEKRWTNLRDWHEMYNAGHLIEAGVAHFESTGKRTLLDVVCRYADYIDSVFGRDEGKKRGYCGHPEIELALVRLYHTTLNVRYLDLARYFVDERGSEPNYFEVEAIARGGDGESKHVPRSTYNQSHKPVREQDEAVGHAVRAAYLYSAMADLAREDNDASLRIACERLWSNLTTKRMYVMGGIGTSAKNEGFTDDYDLPNESAYAETCAAIALVFWAKRMLQVDCDRRYADIMELALYNAVLSGISHDGCTFFYSNPLSSEGSHHRWVWHVCPCCPPNLSRLIASIGGYIYLQTEDEVAVNLYMQSEAAIILGGRQVTLRQVADYPWDGAISLQISVAEPTRFCLRLRIPEWCTKPQLRVNGAVVSLAESLERGYAVVNRLWSEGDSLSLDLPMEIERIYAHPNVRADIGLVTLRRGPLVYCLEQIDQEIPLHRIVLPESADLATRHCSELLGGVLAIEGEALAFSDADWNGALYRSSSPRLVETRMKAIPYFAWDNRAPGEMQVWVRELPDLSLGRD